MSYGGSHSDKIGSFDLCEDCQIRLFELLKNVSKEE